MSVEIGLRWKPAHAVMRDSEAGSYGERYPLLRSDVSSTELVVQRALLAPKPLTLRERLFGSK